MTKHRHRLRTKINIKPHIKHIKYAMKHTPKSIGLTMLASMAMATGIVIGFYIKK